MLGATVPNPRYPNPYEMRFYKGPQPSLPKGQSTTGPDAAPLEHSDECANTDRRLNKPMWEKPRDPDRIPEILGLLETRWKAVPDQRLGQVIINLVRKELSPDPENEGSVLFSVEDEVWIKLLTEATQSDTSA